MMKKGYSVKRLQRFGYVFILPTLVFFAVFLVYPLISAIRLSFYEWSLLAPKRFVGLDNFILMLGDSRLRNSYLTTVHFTLIGVVSVLFISFLFALAFTSGLVKRFNNLLQTLIFIPVVLSAVACGVVWKFMFQSTGLLSVITIGMLGTPVPWLSSTAIAPYSLIMVYVWKSTGYFMVMFVAGLLDIPEMYYESARIDGAGFLAQLVYITLPFLKNTITLAVVSCSIWAFGAFPLQFVISEGGPSRSTEVISLLIYKQAFEFIRFGYSAAISVLFFCTLLVVSVVQLRILKSQAIY